MRSRAAYWLLLMGVGASLGLRPAGGQELTERERATASEYGVKAAFLLNFTKFVEWPPVRGRRDAREDFQVCMLGVTPFGPSLEAIFRGESAAGRKISVRRLKSLSDSCDVLFIPASEPDQASILRRVGPGVLTVGESSSFLRDGGIIRFVIEDRRVRFDVNRRAAERGSLRISSRLLAVARAAVE